MSKNIEMNYLTSSGYEQLYPKVDLSNVSGILSLENGGLGTTDLEQFAFDLNAYYPDVAIKSLTGIATADSSGNFTPVILPVGEVVPPGTFGLLLFFNELRFGATDATAMYFAGQPIAVNFIDSGNVLLDTEVRKMYMFIDIGLNQWSFRSASNPQRNVMGFDSNYNGTNGSRFYVKVADGTVYNSTLNLLIRNATNVSGSITWHWLYYEP